MIANPMANANQMSNANLQEEMKESGKKAEVKGDQVMNFSPPKRQNIGSASDNVILPLDAGQPNQGQVQASQANEVLMNNSRPGGMAAGRKKRNGAGQLMN